MKRGYEIFTCIFSSQCAMGKCLAGLGLLLEEQGFFPGDAMGVQCYASIPASMFGGCCGLSPLGQVCGLLMAFASFILWVTGGEASLCPGLVIYDGAVQAVLVQC